jgi:hypothetical protein
LIIELFGGIADIGGFRRRRRAVSWTELDEQSYYDLISQLRACLRADEPFWSLEGFWTVTND